MPIQLQSACDILGKSKKIKRVIQDSVSISKALAFSPCRISLKPCLRRKCKCEASTVPPPWRAWLKSELGSLFGSGWMCLLLRGGDVLMWLHFSSLCSLRCWGDQPGVSEEGIRSVWRLEGQLRWVKSSVAYHLLYLGKWIWRYVCHRLFVPGQFSVASISAGVARDAAKRIGRASQRPSASRNPLNCTCQHVWRV